MNCCMDLLSCWSKGPRIHDLDVAGDGEWGIVRRKGNQFMVGGQPFYVNGFNTSWLMILAVDPSTRGKITKVFQEALSVGLTVCRTWAFSDGGWRALQKSPSVYDEDVFKALDFVVSEARKYKIRLVLSLTNNWKDYGGKAQYVKWGKEAGLNLTSDEDFFSDPTIKSYYKAHVKNLLMRVNTFTNVTYKDDPTILAWELMNEPRCLSDPSGNKLQEWIEEMAFHVKSIDPVHLLEIGVEGFYGPSSPDRLQFNPDSFTGQIGTDFIRFHQVLGIDFASVHIYPDSWLSNSTPEDQIQFVKSWMQAHIDDAETKLGMPVVFGEFGVSTKDTRFNKTFRDEFFDAVFNTQLKSMRKGGSGVGCLLWQLFPEGTDYMDDGYAVVLSRAHATSDLISLHSKMLKTSNSRCTWRCPWGSKKRNHKDVFQKRDEL